MLRLDMGRRRFKRRTVRGNLVNNTAFGDDRRPVTTKRRSSGSWCRRGVTVVRRQAHKIRQAGRKLRRSSYEIPLHKRARQMAIEKYEQEQLIEYLTCNGK